jgi:hypothetical protein
MSDMSVTNSGASSGGDPSIAGAEGPNVIYSPFAIDSMTEAEQMAYFEEFAGGIQALLGRPTLPEPKLMSQQSLEKLKELLKVIFKVVEKMENTNIDNKTEIATFEAELADLEAALAIKKMNQQKAMAKKQETMKWVNLSAGVALIIVSAVLCPGPGTAVGVMLVGAALLTCSHMEVFAPDGPFDELCDNWADDLGMDADALKILLKILIIAVAVGLTGGAAYAGTAAGSSTTVAAMIGMSSAASAMSTTNVVTDVVTMICEEKGLDEEETEKIAMIVNIIVMVLMIIASLSMGFAGTGVKGGEVAAKTGAEAGKTGANTAATEGTKAANNGIRASIDKAAESFKNARTSGDMSKAIKALSIASASVSATGSTVNAITQAEMAQIEKNLGELEADSTMLKLLQDLLATLMGDFSKAIESSEQEKSNVISILAGIVESENQASQAMSNNTSA